MNTENANTENNKPNEVNEKLLRNKKWLVITLLIVVWPIGLYLLIKSEVFKSKDKSILAGILISVIALGMLTNNDNGSHKNTEPTASTSSHIDFQSADTKVNFTITSDEHKRNIKRTVEVELAERIDEKSLARIAKTIFSMTNNKYERTFIGYRLRGDANSSYWATTHFNPNLEIVILGADISTHEKSLNAPLPNGEIIGTWLSSWGFGGKLTAYQNNGIVYLKTFASQPADEMEASVLNGKVKLHIKGGREDEFYLINANGNLEFWSDNGNYYTAPKL